MRSLCVVCLACFVSRRECLGVVRRKRSRSLCLPEISVENVGKCKASLRFVSETFRHKLTAYQCIQMARTPKDSLAETQIQNYFWVLVRVSYGRHGPAVIVLTPDKRCAAVRVL